MIHDTGGVTVLAHPWALKNPVAVIRRLKDAGLQGLEVYRSDGKLAGTQFSLSSFSQLFTNMLLFIVQMNFGMHFF